MMRNFELPADNQECITSLRDFRNGETNLFDHQLESQRLDRATYILGMRAAAEPSGFKAVDLQ